MTRKYFVFIMLLLVACACMKAQTTQRIKLTQLEQAPNIGGSRAGMIGLSNAAGDQRYSFYVNVGDTCIFYTPTPTGNSTVSIFVQKCATDSIWYIDWEGRSILLAPYGASAACDEDFLQISDNSCPDNLTDSLYKYNYVSIGARYVWPLAELLVSDSTAAGVQVISGNRNARLVLYDNLNEGWATLDQGGTETVLYMTDAGQFTVRTATNPPQAPGLPHIDHFSVRAYDSTLVAYQYPNTRRDTQQIVNFLYTDGDGVLRSQSVDSLGGGGGAVLANQGVIRSGDTIQMGSSYNGFYTGSSQIVGERNIFLGPNVPSAIIFNSSVTSSPYSLFAAPDTLNLLESIGAGGVNGRNGTASFMFSDEIYMEASDTTDLANNYSSFSIVPTQINAQIQNSIDPDAAILKVNNESNDFPYIELIADISGIEGKIEIESNLITTSSGQYDGEIRSFIVNPDAALISLRIDSVRIFVDKDANGNQSAEVQLDTTGSEALLISTYQGVGNLIGFDRNAGNGVYISISDTLPTAGQTIEAGADGTFYFADAYTAVTTLYTGNGNISENRTVTLDNPHQFKFNYPNDSTALFVYAGDDAAAANGYAFLSGPDETNFIRTGDDLQGVNVGISDSAYFSVTDETAGGPDIYVGGSQVNIATYEKSPGIQFAYHFLENSEPANYIVTSTTGADDNILGFGASYGGGMVTVINGVYPTPGQTLIAGADQTFYFANPDTVGVNIYKADGTITAGTTRNATLGTATTLQFEYDGGTPAIEIHGGDEDTLYTQYTYIRGPQTSDTYTYIDASSIYNSVDNAGQIWQTTADNNSSSIIGRYSQQYRVGPAGDFSGIRIDTTGSRNLVWLENFNGSEYQYLGFDGTSAGGVYANVAGQTAVKGYTLKGSASNNNKMYMTISASATETVSATAQSTFTVNVSPTALDATYQVFVTPLNSLTAGTNFYVNNKTTSSFDVVFTSALTGSVSFDWFVTDIPD